MLDGHQALEETRLLVDRLDGPTTLFSDHITNFLNVHGSIPEDKQQMLAMIDDALCQPLDSFRPPTEQLVGLSL